MRMTSRRCRIVDLRFNDGADADLKQVVGCSLSFTKGRALRLLVPGPGTDENGDAEIGVGVWQGLHPSILGKGLGRGRSPPPQKKK